MNDDDRIVYGILMEPWARDLQKKLTPDLIQLLAENLPEDKPSLMILLLIVSLQDHLKMMDFHDHVRFLRALDFVNNSGHQEGNRKKQSNDYRDSLLEIALKYGMLDPERYRKPTLRQRIQRFFQWIRW